MRAEGWDAAMEAAGVLEEAGAWRRRLAERVLSAAQARFVWIATCPPGRPLEARWTVMPSSFGKVVDVMLHQFIARIEASPDGLLRVSEWRPNLYAPLEGAHSAKVAEELRTQVLLPLGIRGLVNALIGEDPQRPLGWIGLAGEDESEVLLRRCQPLVTVVQQAARTLSAAVSVAESLGMRLTGVKPGRLDGLTVRERQILSLVASGLTDVNIAHRLGISEQTVGTHLKRAYAKLGVHSRVEAVALLAE